MRVEDLGPILVTRGVDRLRKGNAQTKSRGRREKQQKELKTNFNMMDQDNKNIKQPQEGLYKKLREVAVEICKLGKDIIFFSITKMWMRYKL